MKYILLYLIINEFIHGTTGKFGQLNLINLMFLGKWKPEKWEKIIVAIKKILCGFGHIAYGTQTNILK